ncbi:uncharacterized protein [Salvelinus alpinus]|uniref:uncharacterized protein n=1 Tax=Salvelinus alpinus TaxID=8036 RepID=UPI0039FDCA8D
MALFIPDMAGHLFLVILLLVTFQYIEAQGHYQGPYPKPDITGQFDEDFNIVCLIPGSVSPNTTCNLYVGEESQPSFTAKIKKRKTTSASGQQFCQFFPNNSDLISRLQSVRRKEVSCDYRVSSGPNSLSLRSDGKSITGLTSPLTPSTAVNPTSGGQSSTESVLDLTVTSTLTPGITVRPTTSLTSPLTPSTAVNPTSGGQSSTESVLDLTVTSTLTPGITVRPTTSLTSPLTPSTAVNPTSGGQSSTESVLDSTVISTLITGITVRPTTSLTSPLTPSTAVNPTSGGQSSTESILAGLTVTSTLTPDVTVRPTSHQTAVQLWQIAVGVASGVAVFLMGLTAVYLCRRTSEYF